MTSTRPSIPVLGLAGTPGQIGAAHGESQRDRIREYADRFLGWLLSAAAVRLTEQPLGDHTNHYLAADLRDTEFLRAGSLGGSLARYTALRRFMKERGDRLTVEALMELTRNHTSFPRSIGAHGVSAEPEESRTRTVVALVQVPADGVMHVTNGCACEAGYHAVTPA